MEVWGGVWAGAMGWGVGGENLGVGGIDPGVWAH